MSAIVAGDWNLEGGYELSGVTYISYQHLPLLYRLNRLTASLPLDRGQGGGAVVGGGRGGPRIVDRGRSGRSFDNE